MNTCSVPDCTEAVVSFEHFPTVTGYCAGHGGLIASFLSRVDAPMSCDLSLEAARRRWARIGHSCGF